MYPPRTGLFLAHYCRLPASEVGMIIDKGVDFPQEIDAALRTYGESMWFFREQPDAATTRALNTYTGDHREYVPGGQYARFSSHLITCILFFICPLTCPPFKLPISHSEDTHNTL